MSEASTSEQPAPKAGDIQVWYIPQVPAAPFFRPAANLVAAVELLDTLAAFSLFEFENKIKPDYADVGGVERYEDAGRGLEWIEVDEDELEAAAASAAAGTPQVVLYIGDGDWSALYVNGELRNHAAHDLVAAAALVQLGAEVRASDDFKRPGFPPGVMAPAYQTLADIEAALAAKEAGA